MNPTEFIFPFGERVLVSPDPKEDVVSPGGLVMMGEAAEKPYATGVVVANSKDLYLQIGMRIAYSKHGGLPMGEYLLLNKESVFAFISHDERNPNDPPPSVEGDDL